MNEANLNPDDFDRLLLWLDPNRTQAALKYEKTRSRLITFFAGGGCCSDAERLTDEAFDRVSQKLKNGEVGESHDRDKVFYFLGFARNIRLEHLRKNNQIELSISIVAPSVNDNSVEEAELECLDQCMDELPTEKRSVVMAYYRFEGAVKIEHRKEIADQLGIDIRTLRLRIHRIREQLKPCIEHCLVRMTGTS